MLILKRYLEKKNDIQAVHTIDRLFGSKGVCEIRVYLSFTVRMWSVWTVVILTTERFLLILFPLRFQKFLSPKVAWITIGCSTLLIGLISLPWLFSFSYVVQKDCSTTEASGSSINICKPGFTFFVCRVVEIPLMTLIPGIILLVENMKISATLSDRRRMWLRVTSHRENNLRKVSVSNISTDSHAFEPGNLMAQSHVEARRSERQLTIRLFLVSMVFWVLSVPSFIMIATQTILEFTDHRQMYLSWPVADAYYISTFLFILNLSINFIIYCAVGSTFRRAFRALITCHWKEFTRLRDFICRDLVELTEHSDAPEHLVQRGRRMGGQRPRKADACDSDLPLKPLTIPQRCCTQKPNRYHSFVSLRNKPVSL
ncbi:hypothetical protein T265_10098 [Opisthorchis viverrini]|uniref:G-protein coupled receptors family 1 profile domain-containing protein n=1 Tax=Opisthorchis viverrini TaxID=6198 RepID=A0A074Z3K4_OPIVI|nr:hypothetical protein T265_10098 [Opisthorchis viverrini]KER21631.1 hypothetical protein T265_10098 [Opisthorchis viverrini]